MPRRAALSRLRNRRWSGRSASASGYAAQQRGRHGGTDRAPRIVHRPTQCLLRGACPTAPACGHTRSRTKTHPTRAFSSVSSVACVQVQPISSLRSHPRSARSPEPFSNHRKLSDQHRAAHGPARLASHTSMPCAARTARAAGEASTEQAQLLRRPSFVLGGGVQGSAGELNPAVACGATARRRTARRRRGGGEAATARGRGRRGDCAEAEARRGWVGGRGGVLCSVRNYSPDATRAVFRTHESTRRGVVWVVVSSSVGEREPAGYSCSFHSLRA